MNTSEQLHCHYDTTMGELKQEIDQTFDINK